MQLADDLTPDAWQSVWKTFGEHVGIVSIHNFEKKNVQTKKGVQTGGLLFW